MEEPLGVFLALPGQTASSVSCFCLRVLHKGPGSCLWPRVALQASLWPTELQRAFCLTQMGFISEPAQLLLFVSKEPLVL